MRDHCAEKRASVVDALEGDGHALVLDRESYSRGGRVSTSWQTCRTSTEWTEARTPGWIIPPDTMSLLVGLGGGMSACHAFSVRMQRT